MSKPKRRKATAEVRSCPDRLALILRPTFDARYPGDRRTKRLRTRTAQRRHAINDAR